MSNRVSEGLEFNFLFLHFDDLHFIFHRDGRISSLFLESHLKVKLKTISLKIHKLDIGKIIFIWKKISAHHI